MLPTSVARMISTPHRRKTASNKFREETTHHTGHREAEGVQNVADSNNSKEIFTALKAVYGPSKTTTAPLLSADGSTLLKDKASVINHWREHFSNLPTSTTVGDSEALDMIPQKPTLVDRDLPSTLDELKKAVDQTISSKAAGMDGIPG